MKIFNLDTLQNSLSDPIRNILVHIYKYTKNNKDGFLHRNHISLHEYYDSKNRWERRIEAIYNRSLELRDDFEFNIRANSIVNLNSFKRVSKVSGDLYGVVISKDGHIYRAIRREAINDFVILWNSGLLQALMEYKLIPNITVSNYATEQFPMILEVERVDVISPKIWTMSMTKEAAILIALIKEVANRCGFMLSDGHTNNIGLKNNELIYFDIGSFLHINDSKGGTFRRDVNCGKQVVMTCCYKIVFSMLGNMAASRWHIYDEFENGIRVIPYHFEDTNREFVYALKLFRRYHLISGGVVQYILHKVFDELSIKPYYFDLLFNIHNSKTQKPLFTSFSKEKVLALLESVKEEIFSVGEMGGSGGQICECLLNNNIGQKGIVLEYNERSAEHTSTRLASGGEKRINVYLFNYLYESQNDIKMSIISDLAVIVDIGHNNNNISYSFNYAMSLDRLASMSKKYVLCTFSETPTHGAIEDVFLSREEFEKECQNCFSIVDKVYDENYNQMIYLFKKLLHNEKQID